MKNNKNKPKYIVTISLLFLMVTAICLFIPTVSSKLLLSASVILIFLIILLSFNVSKNIFFICFLICFFVFLLGTDLLELVFVGEFTNKLSEETRFHTYLCLFLSIVSLWFGYTITFRKEKCSILRKTECKETNAISVRKVCLFAFYLSFVPYLLTLLDTVIFVQTSGYNDYYVSYSSNIPVVIQKVGDLCPLSFFIFIASMPNKKQLTIPSTLMIVCCFLNLLTGKRFFTIALLMILISYAIKRNNVFSGGEKWFKNRYYIYIAFLTLFAGGFLSWYGYYRMGISSSGNLFEHFLNFIEQTGKSINVISYGYDLSDKMPYSGGYLFGNIYDYLRSLFGGSLVKGQTVNYAMNGHAFSYSLSYLVYGDRYLAGDGLGSCYIAEAFFDLGYFGVVIVNLFVGILFRNLLVFDKGKVWKTGISLYLLSSLLLMPRGSFDKFICEIVNAKVILFLVILYLSSLLYSHRMLSPRRRIVTNE